MLKITLKRLSVMSVNHEGRLHFPIIEPAPKIKLWQNAALVEQQSVLLARSQRILFNVTILIFQTLSQCAFYT